MTECIVDKAALQWWCDNRSEPITVAEIVEAFKAGAKRKADQQAKQLERDREFDTGNKAVDDLLMEVYWLGQGNGGHDAGVALIEKLDVVIKLINGAGVGPDQHHTQQQLTASSTLYH